MSSTADKIEEEIKKVETFSSRALDWVKNGHLRTIAYVIIAIIFVLGFNEIRDLKKERALDRAEMGTLRVGFQQLGDAYTGQGKLIESNAKATQDALGLQGKQTVEALTAQGNQIKAMFDAQGRILAEVVKGQINGSVNYTANGGFNVDLPQSRGGGKPALTDVQVFYDPTNPNPQNRISSSWRNNTEVFHPSVIEWQKKNDKSLTGTFRLTRDVYKSDGTLVGKEDIPLTDATASFSPKDFGLEAAPRRWGLALGPVWDYKDQKWYPGGGFDYRVSTNNLVQVGVTKNNAFVWWHYFIK